MTRLVLPTVSESDELFINGFVIVQERQTVTTLPNVCASPVWKNQHLQHEEKVRPHPIRQRSSFLWRDNCEYGKKRRSRQSGHRRKTAGVKDSSTTNHLNTTEHNATIIKNHMMETTKHAKSVSDHIPRPPIRTLPSLYFP